MTDHGDGPADGVDDAGHPPFPLLPVRSLAGAELLLPRDLPTPLTLVLCAFYQRQQGLVDGWIGWAVEDAGVAPSLLGLDPAAPSVVIEVPVLGRRYRPARRFIDGGMASGIGVPEVLARTFTAYTDVSAFCRSAGIATTDTVSALVVRPDGAVLAHVVGPPAEESCAVVVAALAAVGGPSSR